MKLQRKGTWFDRQNWGLQLSLHHWAEVFIQIICDWLMMSLYMVVKNVVGLASQFEFSFSKL